jgi:DNA-binding NarL/FixJ family response regulator
MNNPTTPTRPVRIGDRGRPRDVPCRSALRAHHRGAGVIDIVAEAADVDSAVAAIREHQPHVVLLDVHLPGGGGVRGHAKNARCPMRATSHSR